MNFTLKSKYKWLCPIIFLWFFTPSIIFAQTPEALCSHLKNSTVAFNECVTLNKELKILEEQIAAQELELAGQKKETGTLSSEVKKLQSEIAATKSKIASKNGQIRDLGNQIDERVTVIQSLDSELSREQASLRAILRRTYEYENLGFLELLFGKSSLSERVSQVGQYGSIQAALHESFTKIRGIRTQTEEEKRKLEEKKNEAANIKAELESDRKKVESQEGETKKLLSISQDKEKSYEELIKERRAQAARIRAKIFELRGQEGISFGEAYDYAVVAGELTSVRPSYILAILKQESNIGKNVGTCNRPGDTLKWRDIMPGPTSGSWRDDQSAYLRITSKLGINPDGQPLSCPIKINGKPSGWGGAMGPSQFIPVTWESYEKRIESILGVSVANPWNPQHSILATALYVKDLGADAKTYTAEREAACKYYSGRGCSAPNVINAFYGDAVMSHTVTLQSDIDVLLSI